MILAVSTLEVKGQTHTDTESYFRLVQVNGSNHYESVA
jgi:hypothetical protein